MNPYEQYWTVGQIADRAHCTIDCVKKWLSRGQLIKTKAGGKTLVSETNFQAFLRASTDKAAA